LVLREGPTYALRCARARTCRTRLKKGKFCDTTFLSRRAMLRRMRPDLYSKAVLTLIALLLTAIACKTFISPETTASAQGSSATSKAQNASPHQNVRRGGKVTADNWDDENHGSSSQHCKALVGEQALPNVDGRRSGNRHRPNMPRCKDGAGRISRHPERIR